MERVLETRAIMKEAQGGVAFRPDHDARRICRYFKTLMVLAPGDKAQTACRLVEETPEFLG